MAGYKLIGNIKNTDKPFSTFDILINGTAVSLNVPSEHKISIHFFNENGGIEGAICNIESEKFRELLLANMESVS